MNKIIVVSLERRFKKFEKEIKRSALESLKILNQDGVVAEIYLAGNELMKQLNKKYRSKNKIANVLSFVESNLSGLEGEFPRPEYKEKFLGEIYFNCELSSMRRWGSKTTALDSRFRGNDTALDSRFRGNDTAQDSRFRGNDNVIRGNDAILLLVHALLHLLGFTHKTKSDRIKMGKKENYVLYSSRYWDIAN